MNLIPLALAKSLNKYPEKPVVIAYSGGVDSQVVLHALAKLKQQAIITNPITVCHVNHGLSENAEQWQAFAKQQCQTVNFPLHVCQVNIQAQAQQSLEALARDARYQALSNISAEPCLILTGHHSDDQAETFLLALKRGSGLKGLSAMAAATQQGKHLLVRPLLTVSRQQIVRYATANNLAWVEDESNQDTSFDRNFIRQQVMPLLSQRWPHIASTINRSSDHCREAQQLLDELAAEDLRHCLEHQYCLSVSRLSALSRARFNHVIRYFLAQQHCLMPSSEQLAQLYQQLLADEAKNPAVKVADRYLRRYQGLLYLTLDFADISKEKINVELNEEYVSVELPDHLGQLQLRKTHLDAIELHSTLTATIQHVIAPNIEQKVSICFCHSNPTCLPDYRQHSRPLKKVLQELNIPPWQRKRIPFLYYDDVLVAAIGYFVCQAFTIQAT